MIHEAASALQFRQHSLTFINVCMTNIITVLHCKNSASSFGIAVSNLTQKFSFPPTLYYADVIHVSLINNGCTNTTQCVIEFT